MSKSFDYDLIVIGGGSGGVRASRMAASHGKKVALVEHQALGGTCVNVGCVPKKLFVYSAHFAEDFDDSKGFGWSTDKPSFNWHTLRDNKTSEVHRLNNIYNNLLETVDVQLIKGRGTLQNAHTVRVDNKDYTAAHILLATGSRPFIPDIPGSEHALVSDDIFYLGELPEKIVIIGGGYIAVEFACILNSFGVDTTLAYRGDMLLRGFDTDIRQRISTELIKKGIKCRFNSNVKSVDKQGNGQLCLSWDNGESSKADHILFATGRISNTTNLGLNNVNISTKNNGDIIVGDDYQTNIPSIYALGDLTGGKKLTPVALAEAMHFVDQLYHGKKEKMDYSSIPTAVFTLPNIATVGLTEEEARDKYTEISIFKSEFKSLKHALSGRDEKTFMKIIVDKKTDKVVGCHMLGNDSGEIIQGIAIAMKAGATKAIFDSTVGVHPTTAEEFVTMRVATSSD
ncbi:MAG: glutathione-disulfide reductase [Endozoicomonadaceae bacterium]|nr:glutathione-disulfide reductase [Endozoicomonadaceae bacterium]